jgi:hypothetical protein
MNKKDIDTVDFIRKTTEAITVISESTKELVKNTSAIRDMISTQNTTNATSFEDLSGKMDGLLTMFKYVVVPLVGGILALVGIKMVFQL